MKTLLIIAFMFLVSSCHPYGNDNDKTISITFYNCDGTIRDKYEDIQIKSYSIGNGYIDLLLTNGDKIFYSGAFKTETK